MLLLGQIAMTYLGFALLALAQARHWRQIAHTAPPLRQKRLRLAGGALILCALPLALLRDGAGFGALLWVIICSVSGFAVAFTLSNWPQLLRPLARLLAR